MTNHTNPTQSMPITMDDDNQPNPPEPAHYVEPSFVHLFLEAVTKHIDMLVETKFNAMVENRRALHLMDQALETVIDEKIDRAVEQAITSHEDNEEHHTQETIEQMAADTARETLKEYARTQQGWVTEDEVKDIITQHVDEEIDGIDWEEKVKDVLREML